MKDLPLAFKLQVAVMCLTVIFTAAFIGVFLENYELRSLTGVQMDALVPTRVKINELRLNGWKADDEGAYFLMDIRPTESARSLAAYRRDIAAFKATLQVNATLANTDRQRLAIAQIRSLVEGPNGWYAANERAFAAKSLNPVLAQALFVANVPPFQAPSDAYRNDVIARINANNSEATSLQGLAETSGICLGVAALLSGFIFSMLLGRIVR